jgi:hypothetical protein
MRKLALVFLAPVFALSLLSEPADAGWINSAEIGDWLKRNQRPIDLDFSLLPVSRAHPPFTYDGEYLHLTPPGKPPFDLEKLIRIATPIRPPGLDKFGNGGFSETTVWEVPTFIYFLTGTALISLARVLGASRRG